MKSKSVSHLFCQNYSPRKIFSRRFQYFLRSHFLVEKMVKIFVEKTFGFWVGEKGAPIPGALSILGVHYEYTQTQCEEGARVVDNI